MSEPIQNIAHLWERDPDNFYSEDPWCSQRLFDVEHFEGYVVDPCAGLGHILEAARDHEIPAQGMDLRDREIPNVEPDRDFFAEEGFWPKSDNIVSNPPYGPVPPAKRQDGCPIRLEDWFVEFALKRATRKVAVFLPSSWINAESRGRWLETLPLYRVYHLGPRPSCPPGLFRQAGGSVRSGTKDFSWYVFLNGFQGHYTGHWLRRDP